MNDEWQSIDEALSVFGERAGKLVELTLKDADNFVAEIEQAINDNNPQAAGLAAHSLKSIMKQVNALSVSDIAYEIEQNGKDGNIETCSEKWPDLSARYKDVREYLESKMSA